MPSGTYFGDGSGGPFSSHPSLRRCALGVCRVEVQHLDGRLQAIQSFCASSPLAGSIQTVSRAELAALVLVLKNVVPSADVTYYIDNKGVFDLYHKGPTRAAKSNSADLFLELQKYIILKNITLDLKWMPSHVDSDDTKKAKSPYMGTRMAYPR